MRILVTFALIVLGLAGDALAQSCASTQGQLEYCKALTNAVRFGFPRYTTALLPTCNANNKGAVAYDTTTDEYKGCNGSAWAAIGGGGSGDVTAVGDCASGACFDGTQGTTLTFNNAGGDATMIYDGTTVEFNKPISSGTYTAPADTDWQAIPPDPTQDVSAVPGTNITITASNAVAGSANAGAEAGGTVTIGAGDAARLTSGDAAGGAVDILAGTGIGNGNGGAINITGGTGSGSGVAGVITLTGSSVDAPTGAVKLGAIGTVPSLASLYTGTAGFPFTSATAASGGVDIGFNFTVTGNLGTADRVVCIGDNADTACGLGYVDGGGNANFAGQGTFGSTVAAGASTNILWSGRTRMNSSANGKWRAETSSAATGVVLQFTAAPAIASGFGTTPSIAGTDSAGRVTVGSGGTDVTGAITFASAWGTAPACVCNNETTILLCQAAATTTTLTLTSATAFTAADTLTYLCVGY